MQALASSQSRSRPQATQGTPPVRTKSASSESTTPRLVWSIRRKELVQAGSTLQLEAGLWTTVPPIRARSRRQWHPLPRLRNQQTTLVKATFRLATKQASRWRTESTKTVNRKREIEEFLMQISYNKILLVCRISFNKIKTQWIINSPSSMACSHEYLTSKETTSSKMESTRDWTLTWAISSRSRLKLSCTPSSPLLTSRLRWEQVLEARSRWRAAVRISWRSGKQPSTASLSVRRCRNPCHLRRVKCSVEVTASNSAMWADSRTKARRASRNISASWLRGTRTCLQAPILLSMEYPTNKAFRRVTTSEPRNRSANCHTKEFEKARRVSD